METNSVLGNALSAYGLYINIQDERLLIEVDKSNAEHIVEVAVKIGDTTKEFTLAEFKNLLGFDKE